MMKKIFFVLCVAIFTGGCIRADAASVTLKPFPKETYPIEDTILTGVEPNVLFLLDVGSAMTFTPQGTMPLFDSSPDVYASILNIWPEMASATYRAGLLAQSTYGTGTRPFSIGGGNSGGYGHVTVNTGTEQSLDGYSRFGRDLIPSDNIIGDTNSYYTPDPAKPYLLTFRDKDLAESPTLPPGFSAGVAATNPEQLAQLVPNDSRMYQMKLVLWRLLSEENQQLLSRMRVGMATSYQEINYPKTYQFDFYRNAPYLSPKTAETFNNYGSYTQTYKYFLPDGLTQFSDATSHDFLAYDHGSWRTTPFPHGTAPDWASGIKENFSSATQIQGAPNYIYRRVLQYNASGNGDYGGAQTAYGGVIRDFYSFPMGSNEWRQVNRAVFKIPFDYLYKLQGDGSYIGTNNLLRFRSYIDGIEQGDGDMSDYQDPYVGNPNYNRPEFMWNKGRLTNPELFADGKTPLATSIYGRNFHVAGGNTLKAMQDKNVILLGPQNGNDGTRERVKYQYGYLDFERYKNSEGLMAGGGVGSAMDFFSPREKDLTWNTGTGNDTRGFFPITGSCQANWLVVFTAGNDDVPGYPPEEAVKNLYENSKEMRGRSWDGSKWVEVKKMTMDSGIRTIVVGFVEPPDPAHPDNPDEADQPGDNPAKVLRKVLYRMARVGNPKPNGDPNPASVPYFADNVPALIESLKAVLQQIHSDRFASSAPIVLPLYTDTERQKIIFAAAYTIRMFDQWEGAFSKYTLLDDNTARHEWDLDLKMRAKGLNRRLFTSKVSQDIYAFPNADLVKEMTDPELKNFAGIQTDYPEFRDWLLKYDDDGILGDMEHSGITIVGEPQAEALLDVSVIASRDRTVYLQTNRGVLHAVNYDTGDEVWGFIPPNVFQTRLKPMKYGTTDTRYTGNGQTTLRSKPMALLDGMLVARDMRLGDSSTRTVMIGNMGWGGNGFYAMDITEIKGGGATPKFLWAVDNARYDTVEATKIDGVKRWGKAASTLNTKHDYSDLGLTISATELLSTPTRDVCILPGGLGYKLGEDDQGKVFYIFNPENAEIIQKIDASSSAFSAPPHRVLGMAIAPVTYLEDSETKYTTGFYTADSEGNVMYCDTTEPVGDWSLKSVFQLRTTSDAIVPDEPVAIPHALLVAETSAQAQWVFGGTADLMAPDTSEERKLKNAEQYIFGVNMSVASGDLVTKQLTARTYYEDDIFPPYGESFTLGGVESSDAIGKGWYLKLRPKIMHEDSPTEPEYVTTAPYLYYGVLYVSTFVPRTRHPDDDEKCPELGDAKIYALNPLTGNGMWGGNKKAITMKNIKIAGVSALDGKLYFAVKVLKPGAEKNLDPEFNNSISIAQSTIIQVDAANYTDDNIPAYKPKVPHIQYWREQF